PNSLAVYDPAAGTWKEYPIPTGGSSPAGIAIDGEGNVWFCEISGNKIGVIRAATTAILEFTIPTPACHPEDIRVIGTSIYFSERHGNKISRITVPGITH